MLFGLYQWATIIGVVSANPTAFADLSGPWQFATINLAVAYIVAAVGLWMLASWGVVIWIYATASAIAMHTVFAGTFGLDVVAIIQQLVVIAAYVGLRLTSRAAPSTHRAIALMAPVARAIGSSRAASGAKAGLSKAIALRPLAPGERRGRVSETP